MANERTSERASARQLSVFFFPRHTQTPYPGHVRQSFTMLPIRALCMLDDLRTADLTTTWLGPIARPVYVIVPWNYYGDRLSDFHVVILGIFYDPRVTFPIFSK